jgi:hypothetical protein
MSIVSGNREIEVIAQATFNALREMDAHCPTGLCNYVSCSPYAGKKRKDEPAITWGVTEALRKRWRVDQRERAYPQGRGRCDRVLALQDGSQAWLEVKLAWRTWFSECVKHNNGFMYSGYLNGEHHSHSVAADLLKLEQISADHARYVALLVVGFDGCDAKMADDIASLGDREGLMRRRWRLLADAWSTRQSDDCWIRCWFAWREVTESHPVLERSGRSPDEGLVR